MMGSSINTATHSPSWGAATNTRTLPSTKPSAKTEAK